MNAFEGVTLLFCLLAVALSGSVQGDAAEDIQKAFDGLTPAEKGLFESTLGLPLLDSLKSVAMCIANEVSPIDICNFDLSIDPFYYIKKCANGTLVDGLVQNTVGLIPQATIPFGIPPTVTNNRCFSPLPTISTISPPSILGKDLGGGLL